MARTLLLKINASATAEYMYTPSNYFQSNEQAKKLSPGRAVHKRPKGFVLRMKNYYTGNTAHYTLVKISRN